MKALVLTIVTGIFFLLGILLNKLCKSNKNINILSISLSFVILLYLIIFDIFPEIKNHLDFTGVLIIVLGIAILKIFDFFIPDHNHNHKEKHDNLKEHSSHLEHIGIITITSLFLHNILENAALYNVAIKDFKAGAIMCLAIGLHNLPLGFQIGSNLKNKKFLKIFILAISGFIGGIISKYYIFNLESIELYLECFTLGMLIYLCLFELLKEMISYKNNKFTYFGLILGIIIIIILYIL